MWPFRKKIPNRERLPPEVGGNKRITHWFRTDNGRLDHLAVNGSAKSPKSIRAFECALALSILATLAVGFFIAYGPGKNDPLSGFLAFNVMGIMFSALLWLSLRLREEKRHITVTTKRLAVKHSGMSKTYPLVRIVGVQLHRVDRLRIHEEWRKKRDQKDPRYLEPYSMDLFLETGLGREYLGAIYGFEDARDIANALNCAIQFMKGRAGTGSGVVIDPSHQYRRKSAGQIPE